MIKGNPNPISQEMLEEIQRLSALPEPEEGTPDIPEILDWSRGVRGFHTRRAERLKKPEAAE